MVVPHRDAWSTLGRKVLREEVQITDAACPNCGARDLAVREMGPRDSPTGYAEVKCTTCGHGIYVAGPLSRDQRRRGSGAG
ncbi:hypothetical protein GCM10010309_35450 [Streptomyces violaceochromogenes]|nr:hypothetical protein GCM10010309_35450 [Streptomyces violaceochromogenes]